MRIQYFRFLNVTFGLFKLAVHNGNKMGFKLKFRTGRNCTVYHFLYDIKSKTDFYKEFIRHVLLQRNIMKKKLNRHYKIL